MELRTFVLVGAACSGAKPHAADDAVRGSAAPPAVVAADAAVAVPAGTGDAAIHVLWKNVPVGERASPGRTPCNTPRAPSVAPTTTWGIPDAFVMIDRGGAPTGEAQLVLADCALAARAAAAASLVLASHALRPAQLVLRERGTPAALVDGTAVPIELPIAGHAIRVPLAARKAYELVAGDETAWILADRALVTDATGTATWRDLAAGVHQITAWLPPRAGRPAKLAYGEVTVTAGALADATIDLVP